MSSGTLEYTESLKEIGTADMWALVIVQYLS